MKPNKTFKLSKTAKRMIALMKGSTTDQRNQYKRMMIDAEVTAAIVIKPSKRETKPGGNYTTTSNSATPVSE